jgi:hypothetical protein
MLMDVLTVVRKSIMADAYCHEVHKEGCYWMPSDKTFLGEFYSDEAALAEAKKYYADADGCAHCCPDINHG